MKLGLLTSVLGVACACSSQTPHELGARSARADASTVSAGPVHESASAAPLATSAEPLPPPDPADADALRAAILGEQMLYGWTDPELVKRFTDTEAMHRYDADCTAGRSVGCSLASFGYFDRGLRPLALDRAEKACKTPDLSGCLPLLILATTAVAEGSAFTFDFFPKPGESQGDASARRSQELCASGSGPGCFLAGRRLQFTHHLTIDDPTFDLYMRGCALGHVGACDAAAQEVTVGSRKQAPDRPANIARLAPLVERACYRRPGACAQLARYFEDGNAAPISLGADAARRQRMLTAGCKSKDDPTYNDKSCKALGQ